MARHHEQGEERLVGEGERDVLGVKADVNLGSPRSHACEHLSQLLIRRRESRAFGEG